MNCISRIDDKDKSLFVEPNTRKGRWNLYSEIAIENNETLKCANETYPLIDVCNNQATVQLCTLLDTNEVVDIGYDFIL